MADDQTHAPPPTDDDVLDEVQAAAVLRVSRSTLLRMRKRGEGPPYRMVGDMPRYVRGALLEWLRGQGGDAA